MKHTCTLVQRRCIISMCSRWSKKKRVSLDRNTGIVSIHLMSMHVFLPNVSSCLPARQDWMYSWSKTQLFLFGGDARSSFIRNANILGQRKRMCSWCSSRQHVYLLGTNTYSLCSCFEHAIECHYLLWKRMQLWRRVPKKTHVRGPLFRKGAASTKAVPAFCKNFSMLSPSRPPCEASPAK
jgi:hypothetical protein